MGENRYELILVSVILIRRRIRERMGDSIIVRSIEATLRKKWDGYI